MWFTAALAVAQSFAQYGADKATAKAQQAYQKYKNAMANIGNAVNQNAITSNEIESNAAYGQQAVGIKQSNIISSAQAEVSAAAAGVRGRSVNEVSLDINRNAAVAERQREIALTNSQVNYDAQRQQSAQSAANSQDYSYIPTPKLGSYLLGAAAKVSTSKQGFGDRDTPDISSKSDVSSYDSIKKDVKDTWAWVRDSF